MYILYAPPEKFRNLPAKTPLITPEVRFTFNIAYCSKFFWRKLHIQQGCIDITPKNLIRKRAKRDLQKILIIATGGIGDCLWSVPFTIALRKKYPKAKIIIATEEKTLPLFLGVPYADICLRNDFWNLSRLIGLSDEVYDFGGIATVLKKEMKLDPVEATFKMGGLPLPKAKKDCRPSLVVTLKEGRDIEKMLQEKGVNLNQDKIITIAPEASTPNRNWPYSYTKALTQYFIGQGKKVVWLGKSREMQDLHSFECKCGYELNFKSEYPPKSLIFECPACGGKTRVAEVNQPKGLVNLCGKTNIREAIATIAVSDIFIGPNSGLMVIATALSIPTVGLFGAFNPKTRAKFYEKFIPIFHPPKCGPCNEHWTECREGHPAPCMKVIQPIEVANATEKLLKLYPRTALEKKPME